jgi:hypothetical protein
MSISGEGSRKRGSGRMNKLPESDLGGIFGVVSTVPGYLPSGHVLPSVIRHLRQRIKKWL